MEYAKKIQEIKKLTCWQQPQEVAFQTESYTVVHFTESSKVGQGVMVTCLLSHAEDPGSIPGHL